MHHVGPFPAPDPSRPPEIEPFTNRVFVHRVSAAMLAPAVRAGIAPNAVSFAGLGCGLFAAAAYHHWANPLAALAGFALMALWHVADGLDGALARATGRTSALGRLVDGVADYATFVAVYLALAFSLPDWRGALALAVAAGAAHALQSAFYEAERATYIRRLRGQFEAPPRTRAGGPFEALYNAGERALGNRTRPFDARLAALPHSEAMAAARAWAASAAPRLKLLTLLSANARTVAILAFCLAGSPVFFWLYELVVLTALALAGGWWLRALER